MTTSLLFQQANLALKAGDKATARRLLQQAARQEPQNHKSWLWLASVTPSAVASLEYISRAEALQPHDPVVKKARLWAEKRMAKEEEETRVSSPLPDSATTTPRAGRRLRLLAILLLLFTAAGLTWWWAGFPSPSGMAAAPPKRGSAAYTSIEIAENSTSIQASNANSEAAANQPLAAEPTSTNMPRPTKTATPPPHVPAKHIVNSQAAPLPTWTITPTPSPTPTPTPTPVPTFVSSSNPDPVGRPLGVAANERWIDVDLSQQTLNAYEGNTLVFSTYISSGTWDHPTVTGQFRIWLRFESQTMDGSRLGYDYYLENVPYVMYFYQDYALHGTFWHNNFGNPMSHGCVNMETGDAGWLFTWASIGTVVNVHY